MANGDGQELMQIACFIAKIGGQDISMGFVLWPMVLGRTSSKALVLWLIVPGKTSNKALV